MPKIGELLNPQTVLYRLSGQNRREILRAMADAAGIAFGIDGNFIFESALARESLGGTGIGNGVAVPHARLAGIDKIYGVFALLQDGIDFEAPDGVSADLIFLLISPEDSGASHLQALARISRELKQSPMRAALRNARSKDALFAVLNHSEKDQVA